MSHSFNVDFSFPNMSTPAPPTTPPYYGGPALHTMRRCAQPFKRGQHVCHRLDPDKHRRCQHARLPESQRKGFPKKQEMGSRIARAPGSWQGRGGGYLVLTVQVRGRSVLWGGEYGIKSFPRFVCVLIIILLLFRVIRLAPRDFWFSDQK